MQNQIQEFNVKLVQDNIDITIIDYVKKINDMFYNIDISFIDDFVDMVNNDDFIIHHNMLDKYDVIKITDTSHVKRLFQQHDFEDGVEYISMPTCSGGLINYFLKPNFFKIILIRSKNTKKYAEYYLLLEKTLYHYNQYEKLKLEHRINEINKIKLLTLDNGQTLDNYMIIKCDEDTLHIRKYKGIEYVYKHNYVKFPYATVKGSDKNVSKTLKINKLKIENVVFNKQLPSQINFNKKNK